MLRKKYSGRDITISTSRNKTSKKQAIELFCEYEDKFIKGENVNIEDYANRYSGSNRDDFELKLKLVTLLHRNQQQKNQEYKNMIDSGRWEKIDARICKRVFEENKADN